MLRLALASACAFVFVTAPRAASAQAPTLTALSRAEVALGARVVLSGADFGAAGPGTRVEIGGRPAATSQWTPERIVAFVREDVPLGDTSVRVVTSGGTSATLPLRVTPAATATGRIAWVFESEGHPPTHRPTVAPDGTVYVGDASGFVYAVSPAGAVRWIHDATRASGAAGATANEGPVARAADGTLYVAVQPLGPIPELHALAPEGALRWIHRSAVQGWTVAGPAVAPSGDVLVVRTGVTAEAITPSGSTRWLRMHGGGGSRYDTAGSEIVFGPRRVGGPIEQFYVALYQRVRTYPQPIDVTEALYAIGLDGALRFSVPTGGLNAAFGQRQGQPAVTPAGAVHVSGLVIPHGWSTQSFDPDTGARRWIWSGSPANTMSEPDAAPDGAVLAVHNTRYLVAFESDGSRRFVQELEDMSLGPTVPPGGDIVVTVGTPGTSGRLALTARSLRDGALRFRVELPPREGREHLPLARVSFDGTGRRAYVVTTLQGASEDPLPPWSLVAIDLCDTGESGCGARPDAGVTDAGVTDAGVTDAGVTDAGASPTEPDAAVVTRDASAHDVALTTDAREPATTRPDAPPEAGCHASPASPGRAPVWVVALLVAFGAWRRRSHPAARV